MLLVALAFAGFLAVYHIYGRYLARKIFKLDPDAIPPSRALRDDSDYVPTRKSVLFGHHFASIAGLGPIVGPAIAVIWGWVPAVLWVFFGSIFFGAIHDLGAMVISMRGRGRSIGDLAAEIVDPRVRILFLLIIFFAVMVVIAVFAVIIAMLFDMYPQSVLPVWLQIPIAVATGYAIYKRGAPPFIAGSIAALLLYAAIVAGAYLPLKMPALFGVAPLKIWFVILMAYVYFASTLPVQFLLQPRDYINAFQLVIAMALLVLGVVFAQPAIVAPAVTVSPPGAPPMMPMLFIVVACGAISGFHCLVSSGTSSKQCDNESNALFISYGGMLLEGALSVLAIAAVTAGIGMGLREPDGALLTGAAAFSRHYANWASADGMASQLGAFITGSANMIETLHIPHFVTIAIMGVFLVSFAGTSLDTAGRVQRYVVGELAEACGFQFLARKRVAALFAIGTAFILGFSEGSGKGALMLWPLFGALNQLLAGIALLLITIWLGRRGVNPVFTALPMVFMILMTGWAMFINMRGYFASGKWLLFGVGSAVVLLEIWIIVESGIIARRAFARIRVGQ